MTANYPVPSNTLSAEQIALVLRDRGHTGAKVKTAMTRGSGLHCQFTAPGRETMSLFHGPIVSPDSWVAHGEGREDVEVLDPVAWIEDKWTPTPSDRPRPGGVCMSDGMTVPDPE